MTMREARMQEAWAARTQALLRRGAAAARLEEAGVGPRDVRRALGPGGAVARLKLEGGGEFYYLARSVESFLEGLEDGEMMNDEAAGETGRI